MLIGKDGPLGIAVKELNDNLTPFVEFEKVSTNVEVLDIKIFKGRHEYIMFYDLCHGVASGNIDKKYETMEGPTISSCRWRTYFIRLLLYYIRCINPSWQLKILIKFILQERWSISIFIHIV